VSDILSSLLPIAAVLAAIAFGRLSAPVAGLLGALLAATVALTSAPNPLSMGEVFHAAGQGCWLVVLLALVILGGLFFRDAVAVRGLGRADINSRTTPHAECFNACFLVGPFMESVTGYGVGQIASIALLQRAELPPLHVAILALFSQTLVPWGAMANGTVVGAALADMSPVALGIRSAIVTGPLLIGWLGTFWWVTRAAGVGAGAFECFREVCWVFALIGLLVTCNWAVGPEIACVTALAPLIALRFWLHQRPSAKDLQANTITFFPYLVLVAGLIASRSIPQFSAWLETTLILKPFASEPSLVPLRNPGSWLLLIGALTLSMSKPEAMGGVASHACRQGARPLLTIMLFLVMAKLMTASGMSAARAEAIHGLLGSTASLAAPALAGLFGFITGSANASAGLLMQTQVRLAHEASLDTSWIAAIQNTAGAALTMLSPVRVAVGCAFAGVPHLKRLVYARSWPLGVSPILILTGFTAMLLLAR
jgi:lactate permease